MTQAPQKPQLEKDVSISSPPTEIIQRSPIETETNQTDNQQQTYLPPLAKWFYNLSIRRKQLLPLLTAQILSILALLGVGVYSIVNSGREQLVNQSISELEATKINYNIKIDQMGFGFRGQSDNLAIINAAIKDSNGQPLTAQERQIVKNILQNEIKARNIEYATLVGRDLEIIVNANNDRSGEVFDPNGLVSEVLSNPEQIKTSEITPWQDIQVESPPLIGSLSAENNVLTRYTITPVFRPNTQQVVGVLVSGDTVDGKFSIVEDTIDEFNGGYAAIYKVNDDSSFQLASSLQEEDANQGSLSLLEDESVLTSAVNNPQEIVSARTRVGNQQYTVTAEAIRNNDNEPIAVLVRGTPEKALNQIIRRSLVPQSTIALLLLFLNFLLILFLARLISRRIESLQKTTETFAEGNYQVRANIIGHDEIGNLGATFNQLADNIESNKQELLLNAEQREILQQITGSTALDQEDVDKIFDQSLITSKQVLGVDRLVIYRFKPDWSGYISNEAGDDDLPSALNEDINDPCIPQELRTAYLNNRVVATEDVFNAGFAPEHEALMVRLEIKSNLVVPIISQGQLFALLIAHHCRRNHQWQEKEISFMGQIALRYGVILDRINILKDQMATATRAEQLKEISLAIANSLTRETVLETTVNRIRPALGADRTIVYEFDQDWQGTIIAESVLEPYPPALGAMIADPCFADKYVEKYQQGRVQATPDIYKAGLTDCHLKQLEPFQVRANLVAPIIVNQQLIGLLICHQCSQPRNWETGEIELFSQLSTQVGLGLERVKLIEAQQKSELEQRQAKENLQQRALELLMQVDPVSQGDLTIRATVTEDEIGTIADSYNATVESLRKIVAQVQSAAVAVTETTTVNENDVNSLQIEIKEQVENLNLALEKITQMSRSSTLVAESAEQAEEALQQASQSVDQGEVAMNRTVQSIMQIRATVQQASEQVKRLGDTTQNISNVVGLIGRFAAQTHMLALKASIEAARAGEQGQGFAVIADEVRALASQSATATGDIEKLVNEIMSETKLVVTAMEEGSQQVVEGSKLVEETRQSLNQITAATIQINELVEAIAAAAFEQSENSEEVSEKMSDVARVTEKTTVSVNKLSESFSQLLDVARQLESNVSKFKVS